MVTLRNERNELSIISSSRHRVDTMSSSSACGTLARGRGSGVINTALTIPELLLILEVVRHIKCHTGVASQLSESSSPATQALEGMGQGAELSVVFGRWHQYWGRRAEIRPVPGASLPTATRLHLLHRPLLVKKSQSRYQILQCSLDHHPPPLLNTIKPSEPKISTTATSSLL